MLRAPFAPARIAVLFALGLAALASACASAPEAVDERSDATAPATAEAGAALRGWRGHELEPQVQELYRDYGLALVPSPRWSADDVGGLLRGARSMPKALFGEMPRPFLIERSGKLCLFGMGRYSASCPTFGGEDSRTFFVYDAPPLQGDGNVRRWRPLDEAERLELQRRRAVVHLVMSHVDRRHRLSLRRNWQLINGWEGEGADRMNRDAWSFSRYLGERSPHLDLVTFAEEYFARPEDVLRESQRPGTADKLEALDPDLALACQAFTKIRAMDSFMAHLAPGWERPLRGPKRQARERGEDPSAKPACPQFEMWAGLDRIEGVDLLLAAATSDRPESLYGHLLLHVRYRDDGPVVHSEGFEPVYQFGAITDTDVSMVDYFTKGLLGGFASILQPNTFRGVDRLFLQYEQRSLKRYALQLTPDQRRRLMERLWEAERSINYNYLFLSDNCASLILDVLAPAVEELDFDEPPRAFMMPTEVLEVLASVYNPATESPLLIKRPDTLYSSREVAMDAVGRRRRALARLLGHVEPHDPQGATRLRQLDERLDARLPQQRQAAYGELSAVLGQVLEQQLARGGGAPGSMGASPVVMDAIDYLYYSGRIERYFMDVAFYRRREIQAGALKEPFRMTAKEQLDLRREVFWEESLEERAEAALQWAQMGDWRLREGERRPFTPRSRRSWPRSRGPRPPTWPPSKRRRRSSTPTTPTSTAWPTSARRRKPLWPCNASVIAWRWAPPARVASRWAWPPARKAPSAKTSPRPRGWPGPTSASP